MTKKEKETVLNHLKKAAREVFISHELVEMWKGDEENKKDLQRAKNESFKNTDIYLAISNLCDDLGIDAAEQNEKIIQAYKEREEEKEQEMKELEQDIYSF